MIIFIQLGTFEGTEPLNNISLRNVGVVGKTSTLYLAQIFKIESTFLSIGATTTPLLNIVCYKVLIPPMWSKSRKLIIFNVGRGV